MISLDKIKEMKFNRANIGGYKAEEVDLFALEVEKFVEKIEKENKGLLEEIQQLKQEMECYKKDEKYIKDALISARKVSDMEIRDAKYRADCIINEAVEKSKEIVSNNDDKIKEQEQVLVRMKKEVTDFKARLLNEYKSHLRMISVIEKDYSSISKDIKKENNQNSEVIDTVVEEVTETKEMSDNKRVREEKTKNNDTTKSKFEKLGGIKFGDKYDIKNDEESPIKLFN